MSTPTPAGPCLWVLGAGTALPRASRDHRRYGPSGYALACEADGPLTLLDCGPGSVRQLGHLGLALERVERVLLTHFHPDHCLDVFALTFARRNPALSALPPLELLGPPGLKAWYEATAAGLGEWVRDRQLRLTEFSFSELSLGLVRGRLKVTGVPTGHTPHAVAVRLEFETEGRRRAWVYSGDSGEQPALAQLAAGAELFVCECSFPDGMARADHLTPQGAARLAHSAGVGSLLLTHFYPELDPDEAVQAAQQVFSGPVQAAYDGLSWRPKNTG